MTTEEILAAKALAESSTGPCAIKRSADSYYIVGPDATEVLFTSVGDLASLKFHTLARELVIGMADELLKLKEAERARSDEIVTPKLIEDLAPTSGA